MKARIKDVMVGGVFRTLLTGRQGLVRAQSPEHTEVQLEHEIRQLHPMVLVEAEAVTH